MEVKMQEEEIKAVVESHEAVEVESSIAPTSPVPTEVPTEQATPRCPGEDPYICLLYTSDAADDTPC
eukprot:3439774-Pyramimonas_sp.AAC.1